MSGISVCCRLCLVKNDMLVHLICCGIDNVSYVEKIQLVLPILINNPLNNILIWICQPCIEQLNNAYKFIQNCLASDKFFYEHSLQLTNAKASDNEVCNLDIVNSSENLNTDMNTEPIKEECDIDEYDNFVNIENCLEPLINIGKNEPAAVYIKPEPNINDPLVTCDEKKLEPLFCQQFPAPNVTIKEEKPEEVHKNDISSVDNRYSSEIGVHNQPVCAVEIKQEDDSSDPEYIVPNTMEQAPSEPNISLCRSEHNLQYVCSICNATFVETDALKTHKMVHVTERKFECSICDKTFRNSKNLSAHIITHTDERPYECPECKKTFKHVCTLRRHQVIHTGDRPYECDICYKTFNMPTYLMIHKRIHSDDCPYECRICSKKFKDSASLRRHQSVHSDDRPFECVICNKLFSSTDSLRLHKKLHNNERLFKCDVCYKTFTTANKLEDHQRVHSGERPYECNICAKKFRTRSNMNSHKLIHNNDRPYECNVCNNTFKHLATLKNHRKVHGGE